MIVLALDPSLREFGVSVVNVPYKRVFHSECIKTDKLPGKVGESDTARLSLIAARLNHLCEEYLVDEIWSEVVIGSKSSSAAKALNLCKGMLVGVACSRGIPLRFCTAREAKKKLTGDPAADKSVVGQAVIKVLGASATKALSGPKYAQEAIGDSLAVFLYFLDGTKTNSSKTGS